MSSPVHDASAPVVYEPPTQYAVAQAGAAAPAVPGAPAPLAFCTFNPAGSHLVVFVPGAGLGRLACPVSNDQLAALDVRLVVVDRPGYGASAGGVPAGADPTLALQQHMDDSSARILVLLDALRVQRAILLGHSTGATYVCHFAARHPERVASLNLVGVPSPLVGKFIAPEGWGRTFKSWLLRKCPWLFNALFRSLINKWQNDPDTFMSFSASQLTPTERELDTPLFRARMRASVASALHSTDLASARTTMLAELFGSAHPWAFDIREVVAGRPGTHTHVWQGTVDDVTPNGPFLHALWTEAQQAQDKAAGAAADTPSRLHLHNLEGFGHALIFYKFEDILRAATTPSEQPPVAAADAAAANREGPPQAPAWVQHPTAAIVEQL